LKVHVSKVDGVCVIEPDVSEDERGWFAQLFAEKEFGALGIDVHFVRSALSFNSAAGTLRGLHYQRAPHEDAKLVTCVGGAMFDVVADPRPGSRTFGQWEGFELTPVNRRLVFVPPGVAHGFETLADATTVLYHIAQYYAPSVGGGIRWDDPTLAIKWPAPPRVISKQDQSFGFLKS
jgi:dTDP-4-dehydrorhamnose 3,5-epimerase